MNDTQLRAEHFHTAYMTVNPTLERSTRRLARGACYVTKLYLNLLCDLFTNTSSYQSFRQIALKALFGVTLITYLCNLC